MTPITEELLRALNPSHIEKEYGRNKFYYEVFDTDPVPNRCTQIWVVQGNGTDEQFWNVGFWRDVGRLMGPADNTTIRHGIRYIETVVEFMNWYKNHQS